jgi:hypothetical protein
LHVLLCVQAPALIDRSLALLRHSHILVSPSDGAVLALETEHALPSEQGVQQCLFCRARHGYRCLRAVLYLVLTLIRVFQTQSDMADDTARRIDERRDHEGYPDALPARPNRGTAAHDRGSDNVRALLYAILA